MTKAIVPMLGAKWQAFDRLVEQQFSNPFTLDVIVNLVIIGGALAVIALVLRHTRMLPRHLRVIARVDAEHELTRQRIAEYQSRHTFTLVKGARSARIASGFTDDRHINRPLVTTSMNGRAW